MDNPKIELRQTRRYGRGVYATQALRKGEIVSVFDGRILDNKFDGWTKDLLNHTIQIGRSEWRDSTGLGRYFNHSCEPNCGIRGRFKLVTMRAVKAGEELTWDYEMTEKSWWWRMDCRCGTKGCRKRIGNYRNLPEAIRRKYKGYISTWLEPRPNVRD